MDQNDLFSRLGRIEAKLDILLKKDRQQDEDIASLKAWRNYLTGAWTVISLGVAALWHSLKN
jgi:hypothetical protein